MTDSNRELVADCWSLVREGAMSTTGRFAKGCYSERSGVCRRAELLGMSVQVKTLRKVDGDIMSNDLNGEQRQLVFDPLLSN